MYRHLSAGGGNPGGGTGAPFDETELRRIARNRDVAGLEALLDGFFDRLQRDPSADIRQVRVILIECVAAVCEALSPAPVPPDYLRAARHDMIHALAQAGLITAFRAIMYDGLARLAAGGDTRQSEAGSRYTAEVMAIVRQDYPDPNLSIKTIAAKLHVNAAYLGRTFCRDTGRYFSDYLSEFRIRRAKELLLQPEARIRQVGEQVGYVSPSYFAQVFRQQTGVSPSQWRR